MKMIFTHWEFQNDRLLHRVNVKGEGNKDSEEFLIIDAISIMQTAKEYNGIIVQPWNFPENVKNDVTLTFVIMYKNREDIDRYMKYIESTNDV